MLKYGGKAMNKKGVTLLELIIVMVIIAIGATLMVPAIGSWIPHYRLRSATRDIVSTMRTAQMKAISTNTDHRVSFNTANRSYLIQRRDGTNWVPDGAQQTLPNGVGITISTNNFEFNPNSTATGGNVTLTIRRGAQVIGQRRIIIVPTTGRIRIEE